MHKFDCRHDAFVEGCASCTELAAIERAFAEDRDALIQQAPVPSSAIVWWRAQMQSRRDAARTATEPITFVQGLAIACFLGVLVAAIGFFSPVFSRAIGWLRGASLPDASLPTIALTTELLANPIVIAAVAAIGLSLIILPVALYFTFNEGE